MGKAARAMQCSPAAQSTCRRAGCLSYFLLGGHLWDLPYVLGKGCSPCMEHRAWSRTSPAGCTQQVEAESALAAGCGLLSSALTLSSPLLLWDVIGVHWRRGALCRLLCFPCCRICPSSHRSQAGGWVWWHCSVLSLSPHQPLRVETRGAAYREGAGEPWAEAVALWREHSVLTAVSLSTVVTTTADGLIFASPAGSQPQIFQKWQLRTREVD